MSAALLRVVPAWRAGRVRILDFTFLLGLLAVFVFQLIAGIKLGARPDSSGDLSTICILVNVCFLIGIARAWELVGGPSVNLRRRADRPPVRGRLGALSR